MNTKTAILLAAVAFAAGRLGAQSAEDIRDAQRALKTEGYYSGAETGRMDEETAGAIKRFQIRNGLTVNGELDAGTRAALGIGAGAPARETYATPAPRPDPDSAEEEDREFLRQESRRAAPKDEPAPSGALRGVAARDYEDLFLNTPYERAPAEVQRETVRLAQRALGRREYFTGKPDGTPGPALSAAIRAYQADRGMRETGRLDQATLDRLRLLPGQEGVPYRSGGVRVIRRFFW